MTADMELIGNPELRAAARGLLKGKWTSPVLVTLIYLAISSVSGSIPIASFAAMIVVMPAIQMGYYVFFLKFGRSEACGVETLFDGFKSHFLRSMAAFWLIALFTFLWSLLLIVPGIIAALGYSMAYFIMIDDPKMKAIDALRKSKEMMMGRKGKLFLLYLSFFGWILLGILSLGIGFLWILPYMSTAEVRFYENLKSLPPAA